MLIKYIFSFMIFFSQAMAMSGLDEKNFNTWPKANVKDFGCFLEKKFHYKDAKFNCSLKKYVNKGDPCKNTKIYYEGPKFPKNKVKKVDKRIENITLAWEHGALQGVFIKLSTKEDEQKIRKLFKLSKDAIIQNCSLTGPCIFLTGFDHQGAGDSDCK